MLIFAIDDEPAMLAELHDAIAAAAPDAEIADFEAAPEVLAALDAPGGTPDVVFSDIRLPGMDGLSLAVQIKQRAPKAKLVFVTGYAQYAMEAYRRHVNGYVMKPAEPEKIREELDALDLPAAAPEPADKLRVQCFGHFEVFYRGEPVIFQRRQSKELFAFLIDREGRACTSEEIAAALWENDADMNAAKARIRLILHDLRASLREIGMEDALIRERRQLAVRRELVDCDYYRMLAGDVRAVNAFQGQYMIDYSWAELTNGRLHFRKA
ncbi:MAG: response regulator [Ruminococcaceae bacterium]|nr:response regulator [Oscillospiraceae bacterium]